MQVKTYDIAPIETLSEKDKVTIIRWAEEAQQLLRRGAGAGDPPLGEAYSEYYIDLILLVAKLRDPRGIPALAGAVDIAHRVATALAEFGDPAVEPVIAVLADPGLRDGAVYALGKFIHGSKIGKNQLSAQSASRIRGQILRMVQDASPIVRIEAVRALAYLDPDKEILDTLERVARDDTYHRYLAIHKRDAYEVRDAARETLEKLKRPPAPK